MAESVKFSSHDQYIEAAAPEVRELLLEVQRVVEDAVPGAQRCISYNMPAYRRRKVFFYFAVFKHHLGIYPPAKRDAALIQELAPFRNEKGNLAFPFRDPIPFALIRRVALALAAEYAP